MHVVVSGYANGTTVNMLPVDSLQSPRVVIPPEPIVRAFTSLAQVIRQRKEALVAENATLARIRDTLLPRLVTGQLRLPVLGPKEELSELAVAACG